METYEPQPKLITEWLGYCTTHKGLGGETIAAYRRNANKFNTWMVRHKKKADLLKTTTQDVRDFAQHLELESKRSATIAMALSVVNNFLQWLEWDGKIELAPMPKSILVKGQEKLPRFVPPPQQIFTVRGRRRRNINIEKATVFELSLSTGMRVSELIQVRACDVDFDCIPIDMLTNAPSRFAGGSITLDKQVHQLKSLGRTVPFSMLAGRLLARYMKMYRIPMGSNVPLFPRNRQAIEDMLAYIGHNIVTLENSSVAPFVEERRPGFQDIDLDSLDVDPELKARIAKQKRVYADRDPQERKAIEKRMETPYVRRLHPHAVRHAFAAFMFYRSYHGDRGNLQRIAYYMGHKNPTTSMIYLSKLELVDNDSTWERLWLGRGSDWNQAIGGS